MFLTQCRAMIRMAQFVVILLLEMRVQLTNPLEESAIVTFLVTILKTAVMMFAVLKSKVTAKHLLQVNRACTWFLTYRANHYHCIMVSKMEV